MRSQTEYIITKDQVQSHAQDLLAAALKLEYQGYKCTPSLLLQILLIAAARAVSLFAACRDLADAPGDQAVRNALAVSLPEIRELERRLNRAMSSNLPRAFFRRSRILAIDLTLIPYYGQPHLDKQEIYRSKPKSGTSNFHAYATVVVLHKGHRYTLAVTRVERGEKMPAVVQRLMQIVRKRGVKVRFLLLDKGFFSVGVIDYLHRARYGYVIPAVIRGKKPKRKRGQQPEGLRRLLKANNGYYRHTLTGPRGSKPGTAHVTICVASKSFIHGKTGKRRCKKLLFAVRKVRRSPREIRELYRRRFGIETSYRQMNEARIRTCARNPSLRLLFLAIALLLRNVWVWLHFRFAKGKFSPEPEVFLQLLRFNEMLLWITQVVQRLLKADQIHGITLDMYQRLRENG